MNWGSSAMLFGLWSLPILAMLLWLGLRSRRRGLAKLGHLLAGRTSRDAARIHRTRALTLLLAVGLCIVALARPQWGHRWQELRSEGVSVVVVLDVSRSMDAEDVSPSRMERARREVRDLASMLAGDRVGLVLAAGGALSGVAPAKSVRKHAPSADVCTRRRAGNGARAQAGE